MRLSASVVREVVVYQSPSDNKSTEISFRGMEISEIENIGAIHYPISHDDADDAPAVVGCEFIDIVDFSDNALVSVANLPFMPRLHSFIAHDNFIERIAPGIAALAPRLHTLCLTNNKFATYKQLEMFAQFKQLTHLTLMSNPVALLPHYVSLLLRLLPGLRVLDYQRIKQAQRQQAIKLLPDQQAIDKLINEGVCAELDSDAASSLSLLSLPALVDRLREATNIQEIQQIEEAIKAKQFEIKQ